MRAERLVVHADAGVGDRTARRPGRPRRAATRQRAAARHRVQRVLDDVGHRARRAASRSTSTGGRSSARRRASIATRPRSAEPVGLDHLVARRSATAVGAGRAIGDEPKLENSDAICRSSRTCVRIVSTQLSSTGESGCAAILVHAPQVLGRELDRRQRVLDVVRDLPRHLGPGLEAVRALELAALALQLAGHAVERLDEALQLVGGPDDDARARDRRRRSAASRASAAAPDRRCARPSSSRGRRRAGSASARRAARARSSSSISRSISRWRSASGTVRMRVAAADADRRRRDEVGEVADAILADVGRQPLEGDRAVAPAPGVRVGSRPDANRSRSLVTSSSEPSKMLTSWSMTRLIHTITSSLRPPTVAPASSRCCSASDSSMTRLRGERRARRLGFDVGEQLAGDSRRARAAPAPAPAPRVAATKAMNSLR